jgi:hypothetical protein
VAGKDCSHQPIGPSSLSNISLSLKVSLARKNPGETLSSKQIFKEQRHSRKTFQSQRLDRNIRDPLSFQASSKRQIRAKSLRRANACNQ